MSFRRGFPTRGFPNRGYPAGWSQGTAVANSWWPGGASGDPYMRLFATDSSGSITEYPIDTYHWFGIKVQKSYGQPTRMEFRMAAAQHTTPIPNRAAIWLIDESYGYWGSPVFEGFVDAILPASTLELVYTCFSGTKRAAAEAFVMSVPYTEIGGVAAEGTGAVPSLIYNVKEDADEEIAFSRDNEASLADIVQDILDDAAPILRPMMAAPVDAGTAPYVAADMTDMDFEPQTKIAFTNETVPSAVERTLQLNPRFRALLVPGDNQRQWRIYDVLAATQTDLTLNDYSDKVILSLNLNISTDRRYSATKIYGPRKAVTYDAYVSTGTLTEDWDGTEESNFQSFGPDYDPASNAGKVWQITDPNKRNLASRLPSDGLVPWDNGAGVILLTTRKPSLIVTYDGTTWACVKDAVIDNRLGTVTVPNRVYRYVDGGSPPYELPSDVRLLCAYYDVPLSVRYPTSGYGGTLYTSLGVESEQKILDPGLAVGWENGTPVAEATRTAQFQELCQRIFEATSDIAFAGGCTIAGIDYDFWGLNLRINLPAVDANGSALTTGWEDINAVLTDVEIDYEQRITTLTWNSDQLQFLKVDPEYLKQQLKIDAKQFRRDYGPSITINTNGVGSTFYMRNPGGGEAEGPQGFGVGAPTRGGG